MFKKLSQILKSREGKLRDLDVLKKRLDDVGGNGPKNCADFGRELGEDWLSALNEFFATGTKAALKKYVETRATYDVFQKFNMPTELHRYQDQERLRIKNEPGSRATIRACLDLVGRELNVAYLAAVDDLKEAFGKLGVEAIDLNSQPALSSLRERAEQVIELMAEIDKGKPLDHRFFDLAFTLIDSADTLPVHRPALPSKLPMGMIEEFNLSSHSNIPRGDDAGLRLGNQPVSGIGPAVDVEKLADGSIVPRRVRSGPVLLEDSLSKDGKTLIRRPAPEQVMVGAE